MRLREALVLAAVLSCSQGRAQPAASAASAPSAPSATPAVPALTASAVKAATEAVRADPLLPGTEKKRVLRFKKDEVKPVDEDADNWWLSLLGSLSGGLRVAMWLVGAALLIWVLLRLRDWLLRREGGTAKPALPPTHVGSLDIRPESLPADIGGAARALWQRGELRAALSLLYRGALSRLVHAHGVPIRAASTESECLTLAAQRLAPSAQEFLAQLVAAWQAVAYAQRQLADEDMEQLCAAFDTHLPAAAASGGQA